MQLFYKAFVKSFVKVYKAFIIKLLENFHKAFTNFYKAFMKLL